MKKLIFKIIFNIFVIICIGLSISYFIDSIQSVKLLISQANDGYEFHSKAVFGTIRNCIFWGVTLLINIITVLLLDFKGIKFLTESAIENLSGKKEALEKSKKEKRIAQLEKELNELKKDK
jgi:hypothetical protein